jgi:hypothetical protein
VDGFHTSVHLPVCIVVFFTSVHNVYRNLAPKFMQKTSAKVEYIDFFNLMLFAIFTSTFGPEI